MKGIKVKIYRNWKGDDKYYKTITWEYYKKTELQNFTQEEIARFEQELKTNGTVDIYFRANISDYVKITA